MSWTCKCFLVNNQINKVDIHVDFDKRFFKDKYVMKNENQCVVIDGVLLNRNEMFESEQVYEDNLSVSLFTTKYLSKFRGPFTGVISDGNSLFAFGNQTGDTFVFYYLKENILIISTDFNELVQLCRKNNYKLSFDEIYANHILSFGFAVEGHTPINEIKKTMPGCGILLRNQVIKVERYHSFVSNRRQITMETSVEELDVQFRRAVNRCFQKDKEYGYSHHIADLSGGLDSRMTSWVAHELGYERITNISYAKKDSKESIYSKLVAEYLGNDYVFKPLDDVHFIYDISTLISMNYGLAMFAGITGGKDLLETIDFEKYGLEHTGQIGDVVVGSFAESIKDNEKFSVKNLLYGDRVKPKVEMIKEFKTKELLGLYYRAFQGALSTHPIRRHYTEAVSPFLDVDFIQFCLNLPIEYRCGHRLYFEWIEKKYPEALSIPSTRTKRSGKLTKKEIYHKLPVCIRHIIIRICQITHHASFISDKDGMNPFDLWFENNEKMREFIIDYYQKHINLLISYTETYNQLRRVFEQGRTMDKLLVLTVLAAFEKYVAE